MPRILKGYVYPKMKNTFQLIINQVIEIITMVFKHSWRHTKAIRIQENNTGGENSEPYYICHKSNRKFKIYIWRQTRHFIYILAPIWCIFKQVVHGIDARISTHNIISLFFAPFPFHLSCFHQIKDPPSKPPSHVAKKCWEKRIYMFA
jgi:hypothetical protein